jgi:hypothetical protein
VLTTRRVGEIVTFVKFVVPDTGGTTSDATLTLKVKSKRSTTVDVNVAGNDWDEATITHGSAPWIGRRVGAVDIGGGSPWVTIDVSDHVTEPATYSFALTGTDGVRASFHSSESATSPQLEITTVRPTPTTTTSTSTTVAPISTTAAPTSTTSTSTSTTTTTQTPTATATAPRPERQPEAPIRAAFFYPWFPEAWDQGGQYPFTRYTPSFGLYDSSNASVIDEQIASATNAGLEAFIASWWGAGPHTDSATIDLLDRMPGSPTRTSAWPSTTSRNGNPTRRPMQSSPISNTSNDSSTVRRISESTTNP